MATGNVLSYTGKNHTYLIVDANTSLAANDRSMSNPRRYSITVDGVAEGTTHNLFENALRQLMRTLRARDYF